MDAVWNFFGDWNVDFCLASIPILLLFLHFYMKNREIPLKDTLYFRDTMVMTLVTILFGIVGAAVCAHWKQVPYWLIYLFNVLYYIGSLLTAFCAFRYTMETLHMADRIDKKWFTLSAIPVAVMAIVVITTPWHACFFTIDPDLGVLQGPLYVTFYGFLLFYLVFCFIAAATSENKENKEQIDGLFLSGALIAAGTILEAIDWQTFFLPFFITLGVSCIYITVRNPDLFKDKKTGLLSSAAFNLLMKEPLKHHQACGFGFAIRSYNQCRVSYGSAVVDRYLSHFGEYIRNEFPKKYCFYLDNGHFLIVSPGFMDIHAAIAKIHQQFKGPWIREGESASFDIGCCYIDNRLNYSSPAELRESLELAFNDIDTLEHKDIVVDEKYKQRAERQTHIRKILRKAIETDSIEIFLQPLMDAKTEELTGAEAFARLRDDDGTIIPPGDFIELSNSIGVINALDDQVFDKTCQFISAGGLTRCNMNWIHVNLAPTQCLNLDLADHLNEIRRRYFIPFFTIRLELIEDGALNPSGKKQINLLKEMGFDIVLDDYGTGYSNASRMKDLPFSEIKIDISLVKDYCSHPDPYLPNLVSTMHALGLMITAEGIETKEMADKMKALGVDHLQGYYYSKPLSIPDFLQKYSK